jgi:hypothetical protein
MSQTTSAPRAQSESGHDAIVGAEWLARVGLAGRGGFYAVLVYLTLLLAVFHDPKHPANASGALATVTHPTIGKIAVGAVAFGLMCFGVVSLVVAWRRRRTSRGQAALATVRGLFYLGLAYVPSAYLAGNHQVGSEQQQHKTTGRLLGFEGGQELVIALGLVVVGVCLWQIYSACRDDPVDHMKLAGKPAWVARLIRVTATVGIVARATTILPVGVFLIVAAVQFDPNHAKGLQGELSSLAGHPWGRAVLVVVATGLAVFAMFSLLEARYRDLEAA